MIVLSCQCVVKCGIVAWYQINKDYIAKNLCENKDKPQLKCCGKCYLKKKLNAVDDKLPNGKHLPNKLEKAEVTDFIIPSPISIALPNFANPLVYGGNRASYYIHLHTHAVFHPPSGIS